MKYSLLLAGLIFTLSVACTTVPVIDKAESRAEVHYKRGLIYLEREQYLESEKEFMQVITDYSFSKFEPLAHIGLADTYMGKEEYASAAEVFKRFIKMRPNHEKADYAMYQIGNCSYLQKPGDWWFLPSPEEKDLSKVIESLEAFKQYLALFPQGKYVDETKKRIAEAESLMISKEIKIARFYLAQGKCISVKTRIEYIRKNFSLTSNELNNSITEMETECSSQK